jgi:Mrp family chromosome partitioning ATPase
MKQIIIYDDAEIEETDSIATAKTSAGGGLYVQQQDDPPPPPVNGWRSHVFTAASLKEKKFEPISYVVPQLIPYGVTILAGKPKVGKSWAALDIALALAGGRFVFGEIKLT